MTDLSRGTRSRRGVRRPGWLLLTVLLVLAIGASSALVFTNRVELLKLAVILALWAAVVAAFVSVLYRRQSDIDQAKARDLKLVYDLQLDREISARREYELAVETQLRRELTSELRAQAADEVAGLRAELAALRANLEILFDADLSHRPALESDRARAYSDWPGNAESAGRVTASRIDTEDREDVDANTEESPIIDVPAEPHPPEAEWTPQPSYGGAHRRPSETEQETATSHRGAAARVATSAATSQPQPQPPPSLAARTRAPIRLAATATRAPARPAARTASATAAPEPERVAQAPSTDWQPAPGGGTVDTRRNTWQQLGVAQRCRIRRLSRRRRKRFRRRVMSAGDAHPSRRPPRRAGRAAPTSSPPTAPATPAQPAMQSPPAAAAATRRHRSRRSGTPTGAAHVGRRNPAAPAATPRAPSRRPRSAETRRHRSAGGHRRAVGCRSAGAASGHPDRRRPSQAPRGVR